MLPGDKFDRILVSTPKLFPVAKCIIGSGIKLNHGIFETWRVFVISACGLLIRASTPLFSQMFWTPTNFIHGDFGKFVWNGTYGTYSIDEYNVNGFRHTYLWNLSRYTRKDSMNFSVIVACYRTFITVSLNVCRRISIEMMHSTIPFAHHRLLPFGNDTKHQKVILLYA